MKTWLKVFFGIKSMMIERTFIKIIVQPNNYNHSGFNYIKFV